MRRPPLAAKRDATEHAILDALSDVGAQYLLLTAIDVLVLFRGKLMLLECKSPGGRRTETQDDLVSRGWPVRFVETPAEAWRAIGAEVR